MFSNKAVERQEKMLKSVNHQPYFSHIRLFALHMIKSDGNYIISQGDLQLEELKAGFNDRFTDYLFMQNIPYTDLRWPCSKKRISLGSS